MNHEIIKYIAGPLVGALIGYITNYIAVRMLFRPRNEVRVFGHRLPLTPGAIPKGKSRLAHAAGEVVAKYLVTEEDIGSRFLSESVEDEVVNGIMGALNKELDSYLTLAVNETNIFGTPEEARHYNAVNKINNKITTAVTDSILGMDIDGILNGTVREAVEEKMSGSLLKLFIGSGTIDSLMESLSVKIKDYVAEEGYGKIYPVVASKTGEVLNSTGLELLTHSGVSGDKIRATIREIYRKAVTSGLSTAVKHIDIAGTIESKINEMSTEELERLVLSVMKKELDTIVRLGALIGAVIGIINIFI